MKIKFYSLKKLSISGLLLLGFCLSAKSVIAQTECPINTTCVCHNVDNKPHTICVGDPGFETHLTKHVNNGQDACGPCCDNGTCDKSDGENCSICPADCGACSVSCPDGDVDG